MSSIPDKYRDLLQGAAEELRTLLWSEQEEDAKLVQKGLMLYRQGLVTKVRLEEDNVTATVQDVTPVQVELNLNFFQTSTCTCPAEGICRHQLAAFFYAYGKIASVMEWVENWRKPIHDRKNAKDFGLQRAKDLLKASGVMKPDYDAWVESFQVSFDSMIRSHTNLKPYLLSELFQVYSRKIKASAPVEQEWRQLYFLIATVHSFHNLLKLSTDQGFHEEEISRYYQELFYDAMDDVENLVEKLNVHALPFAFDEFIKKLKDDSTRLISQEYILSFEPTYLYIVLWTKLFKKRIWHEEELTRIMQAEHQTLPMIVGTIHQHVMLKMDEEALRILHILDEYATPFMLFWLEKMTAGKDWRRAGPYIDTFSSMAKKYIRTLSDHYAKIDFARTAIRTVSKYAFENKKLDLYEKILIQTLPYSYRSYDEFLFDQGWYEKWSDLQAYIGYDISYIPKDKLQILQKERPDILLPLYHQSIQQHIEMKNRGNYREAVKQLKKLRTLYKKLKRSDEFQQFLDILLDRTKRLRAFHQECERGKLTHA